MVVPAPVPAVAIVNWHIFCVKFAVTDLFESTVSVAGFVVPVRSPLNPLKV